MAAVFFFALGISNSVLNASNTTRLQLTVPDRLRARTFAAFGTVANLATPLSIAGSAPIAHAIGPDGLIVASGIGLMTVSVGGLFAARRQLLDR